jgi:hypothetical protein
MGLVSNATLVSDGESALPERLVAALRWVFHDMESEAGLRSNHRQSVEQAAGLLDRSAPNADPYDCAPKGRVPVPAGEYEEPLLAMERWACWSSQACRRDGMRAYAVLRRLDAKLSAVLAALYGPRLPGPPPPPALGELGTVAVLLVQDPGWRSLVAPVQQAGEHKDLFDRRAACGRQYASSLKKDAAAWAERARQAFAAAWEAS